MYKYQVSKLIFKCINGIAAVNFQNWFKINHERHRYNRRSNINSRLYFLTQKRLQYLLQYITKIVTWEGDTPKAAQWQTNLAGLLKLKGIFGKHATMKRHI